MSGLAASPAGKRRRTATAMPNTAADCEIRRFMGRLSLKQMDSSRPEKQPEATASAILISAGDERQTQQGRRYCPLAGSSKGSRPMDTGTAAGLRGPEYRAGQMLYFTKRSAVRLTPA